MSFHPEIPYATGQHRSGQCQDHDELERPREGSDSSGGQGDRSECSNASPDLRGSEASRLRDVNGMPEARRKNLGVVALDLEYLADVGDQPETVACRWVLDATGRASDLKDSVAGATPDKDDLTGQAIIAFVTVKGDVESSEELGAELREHVGDKIGKIGRPKTIIFTDDLPKTRSGKIMRRLLRDIAEGRELGDVTTLREPGVMKELEEQWAGDES